MSTLRALVRPPAESFVKALSSHPGKDSIDPEKALYQHGQYCAALEKAGVEVIKLEALEAFPDSTFIEDNAIVLEGTAFITAMAAPSRNSESVLLKSVLENYLPVETLEAPVFIDGGDVLKTSDAVYIGQSERTGKEAVAFFKDRLNLPVIPVPVTNALHLKTAASWLGGKRLILSPEGCDTSLFKQFECIELEPEEAYAANCLVIGDAVLMPAGFKRVEEKLSDLGLTPLPVPMSEFEKADGSITCLSIVLPG